jgi:hypothetical protein
LRSSILTVATMTSSFEYVSAASGHATGSVDQMKSFVL